jgi:hypothetical protein
MCMYVNTADGHYEPIIERLAVATPATIAAMSQAFATVITPLGTAPATRVKAARNWRSCLTWALARGGPPPAPANAHERSPGHVMGLNCNGRL